MTLIGPRLQLVRDMVFMSEEQRMRHTAKPGLSGLAQIEVAEMQFHGIENCSMTWSI